MMKVAALSQSCASVSSPTKNYGTNKSISTGANASKLLNNSCKKSDKSLQKVYCLSSLSFLGCLAIVYTAATFFANGGKNAASHLSKII